MLKDSAVLPGMFDQAGVHRTRGATEGTSSGHIVNYGSPCPTCGSATQVQVHCKLYCSSCRSLLENCNGD